MEGAAQGRRAALRANSKEDRYRAVVTGAAGFIGSHLTESLLAAGHRVLGIDAFTAYYDPSIKRANLKTALEHPNFTLLAGDLNELDLDAALEPGDVIFHLAAQPGVSASWTDVFPDYCRHNVEATHRLLEAARRRDVRRVIFASSSSVYGDAPLPMREDGPLTPVSPYGVTKLTAEHLCRLYADRMGVDVVLLRFFSVYGPRQRADMAFNRFIAAIAAGDPVVVFGDGRQRRDFTFVGDVVPVILAAVDRGVSGVPVNVGGGSAVSVRDTVAILEQLIGRPALIEFWPAPPGDARDTQADTSRLLTLGVAAPRVDVRDGLQQQVRWQLADRPRPFKTGQSRAGSPTGAQPRLISNGAGRDAGPTILLYSHDTYGLGHIRRNLAIAAALRIKSPAARVVLLTGSRMVMDLPLPSGISIVRLPAVSKVGAEAYQPVDPGRSLPGLWAERAGIIAGTLLRLRPDVFLVDHAPLGMKGELRLALQMARETLPDTRLVLGLRDILDDRSVVRALWQEQQVYEAMESSYDQILVYGCRHLYDVTEEYAFPPSLRERTVFTGYVAKDPGLESDSAIPQPWSSARHRVLVMGGGGGDSGELCEAFMQAWPAVLTDVSARALVITGPLMDERLRASFRDRATRLLSIDLLDFSRSVLRLIARAELVVSMGGYNSLVEVISARRPVVACPRVLPRREQLIRSRILEQLGLASVVRLDRGGSRRLAQAIVAALREGPPSDKAWGAIDLSGATRVAEEVLRARVAAPILAGAAR